MKALKSKKTSFKQKFSTRCIHAGQSPDPSTGAVSVPIYATSTFEQIAPGENKGYFYARMENPTRQAFERALADLEEGKTAYAFSSGMAAVAAALELLPVNAHIIASDDLYGGCISLFEKVKKQSMGLSVSYVDMSRIENLTAALQPNTKMLWVETPTNPLLRLADIDMAAAFAKKHKLISVVDNTFATPWNQRPITHGIDIVMHSITKYIGGHSDLIGGALVAGDDAELNDRLKLIQIMTGGILSPFDSFLALRGIKTLDLRMERHSSSTMKIAAWLEKHPKVEKIYFPGLASHPHHALAKKQMRGAGGMISIVLKGDVKAAQRMMAACSIFTLAASLGGVESLIQHPAIMTHAGIPAAQREKSGITDSMVRLSIGIEDADDLIADLENALTAA